jgi:hypothetical protein
MTAACALGLTKALPESPVRQTFRHQPLELITGPYAVLTIHVVERLRPKDSNDHLPVTRSEFQSWTLIDLSVMDDPIDSTALFFTNPYPTHHVRKPCIG